MPSARDWLPALVFAGILFGAPFAPQAQDRGFAVTCGPGVDNCDTDGRTPDPDPYWEMTTPGTFHMKGTDLVIEYQHQGFGSWTIRWSPPGEAPVERSAPSLLDAVKMAASWADDLRAAGIRP